MQVHMHIYTKATSSGCATHGRVYAYRIVESHTKVPPPASRLSALQYAGSTEALWPRHQRSLDLLGLRVQVLQILALCPEFLAVGERDDRKLLGCPPPS